MRRCDQLSSRYGADFYVVVRQNHQHYDYNSSKDPSFPTPLIEIVRALTHGTFLLANCIAGESLSSGY
ncbi:hypothetical protein B0J13DRAFT_563205 [Dactylonectria estremocensis]|uniref:Uncharacterized protein n=1 Tax=Dactylonectria estremocensis TaxID=1079267 RepID=A0A9P9E0C4_9HYPO|nr:hypothetical protein B0J13DRAFT_563205 [Dactylonectria estremocensis]